jgi:hypothetical protein
MCGLDWRTPRYGRRERLAPLTRETRRVRTIHQRRSTMQRSQPGRETRQPPTEAVPVPRCSAVSESVCLDQDLVPRGACGWIEKLGACTDLVAPGPAALTEIQVQLDIAAAQPERSEGPLAQVGSTESDRSCCAFAIVGSLLAAGLVLSSSGVSHRLDDPPLRGSTRSRRPQRATPRSTTRWRCVSASRG